MVNLSRRSRYKAKMKEYEKARNKLSEYGVEVKKYYDEIENSIKKFESVYTYDDGFRGDVAEDFYKKSEYYKERLKVFLSDLDGQISVIESRKNSADYWYEYYRDLYYSCDD